MLEVLLGLPVFFIIYIVLAVIIELFLVDNDDALAGGAVLIFLGLIFAQWTGAGNVWGYTITHPFEIVGWTLAYFVVGLMWTTFRWFMHVKSWERDMKTLISKGAAEKKYIRGEDIDVLQNAGLIANWGLYWPVSMVKYVLLELKQFALWFYTDLFGKLLVGISKNAYSSVQAYPTPMKPDEKTW